MWFVHGACVWPALTAPDDAEIARGEDDAPRRVPVQLVLASQVVIHVLREQRDTRQAPTVRAGLRVEGEFPPRRLAQQGRQAARDGGAPEPVVRMEAEQYL